jgi:heme o synthase
VKPVPAGLASAEPLSARASSRVSDYVALTKPRLNLLVVATSAAAAYLGAPEAGASAMLTVAPAILGTALVAGGSAALNQLAERDTDALMVRTRLRPLPDHRISPREALVFGLLLSAAGVLLLASTTNRLATVLALATLVVYLAIYTPMKRWSRAATLVGAVPGALPPLIGWAAARGTLSLTAYALFGIVFLWQIPHFMAIAWMYRDDYRKAGFPLLAVVDSDGRRTGRAAAIFAAALLPVSVIPALTGASGSWYLGAALVSGLALLALAVRFAVQRTEASARSLFFGSIVYLPVLWAVMIANS